MNSNEIENEKPAFYAVIPASVRYNKNLTDREKLLYAEITVLANKYGYCFASNKYFAELYNVSTRSIIRSLKNLEKNKHIKIVVLKEEGNKRKIYLYESYNVNVNVNTPYDTDVTTPCDKSVTTPYDTDVTTPYDKSVTYNNTSINNTSINNNTIAGAKNNFAPKPNSDPEEQDLNLDINKRKREAEEVYRYYAELNKESDKTRNKERALRNITKLLLEFSADVLKEAAKNYSKTRIAKHIHEPKYIKDPANFYGQRKDSRFFQDFLPGRFEKLEETSSAVFDEEREFERIKQNLIAKYSQSSPDKRFGRSLLDKKR